MQASQVFESLGIEIDKKAPSGEFYWDVRSPKFQANGPKSKFELLVWLGQMPDTNILSNSLIKMIGQHVFDLLYSKATYKSIYGFLQSRRENADKIFDANELQSLWHCWRLIAKLRALQEIDYLFNQREFSLDELDRRVDQAKIALRALYPNPPFSPSSREALELSSLEISLDKLSLSLQNSQTMMDRNAVLQQWQQREFRHLIAVFQQNQGEISAEQHDVLPRENWANTQVTREAEKILQDWEFGEIGLIRDSMLFREDPGEVFHSASYHEIDKRSLLFASLLGENLGQTLGLDTNNQLSFQNLNQRNADDKFQLYALRDHYEEIREEISKHTVKLKEDIEQGRNPDQPIQLQSSSRLVSEWWDLWSTPAQQKAELASALAELQTIKATPEVENPAAPPETTAPAHQDAPSSLIITTPLAYGVSSGKFCLTKPAERNYVFSPGDVLSSSLRFLTDFSGYFDQMMDKHPFIATAFFSIPYLQFGGIGLSMSGNDGMLAIANFFATLESQLMAGKVSAAQINQVIAVIDEAVLWFTSAESSLMVLITCGFTISKVTYTLIDAISNELFNKIDETTLTELAKKLDPSGSLAGSTTRETIRNTIRNIFSGLLLLTVAGSIGVAADVYESALLEFFAHVPVSLITSPSIQTLGALKTSGLLIGKLAGINNYINKEQLIDVNGTRMNRKSPDYQLLILFAKLCSGHEKLPESKQHSAAFGIALKHFEKLLGLNPELGPLYDLKKLKKLGVKRRASAWYQRFPMACFKTIFYALFFLPSLLAHAYYGLRGKPIPPMWKLSLIIPLNWVVLSGKIFWTTAKAVLHGFVQIAARLPEVLAQLSFVALRLTAWAMGHIALAIGQGLKAIGSLLRLPLCQDPSTTAPAIFFHEYLANLLRQVQVAMVTWLRLNIRYPLEQFVGAILKFCRDILVRLPEQALQQAFISTEEKEASIPAEEEKLSVGAEIQKIINQFKTEDSAKKEEPKEKRKHKNNDKDKGNNTFSFPSFFKKNKGQASQAQPSSTAQPAIPPAKQTKETRKKVA